MGIDIVRGIVNNITAANEAVSVISKFSDYSGTLYLGYPLSSTNESVVTVDALLVTKEKGLTAIIFENDLNEPHDAQDLLYFQLTNTLTKYESLRRGRNSIVSPNIVSLFSESGYPESTVDNYFCDINNLRKTIESLPDFDGQYYSVLCEALQKISSMKPKKKRKNVTKTNSKGAIIKQIEKEIANLDEWQKKAAFEIPEGPQRIRGLAGSGKTVVLALKAAYLHSQHPEWNIAITFYTRALSQQLKNMISNFSYEFIGDLPDWEKLHIVHSWGTDSEIGIYSEYAQKCNITPINYNAAKAKYGRTKAFEGVCCELLNQTIANVEPYYDAILIDEAQDMPISFFKLCYKIAKDCKRVVFAYDELQNLSSGLMPSVSEMFGVDDSGKPLVELINSETEARQDITLPICYRNTPWALTLAHCLGFGIYRKEGLVQLFNDLDLWEDIGYQVVNGQLGYAKDVTLKRKKSATPHYFESLIDKSDAIQTKVFSDIFEEYEWVAQEIKKNIEIDELDPDDILVIFPDAYRAKTQYSTFRDVLLNKGINSILAGVNADRDTFKIEGSITCSSIYRAKGNEAPMVYVINSEHCACGTEMITLRNTLFTAITRSRAWVRICGVSPVMEILEAEINKCISGSYELAFKIPTQSELEKMRLIHRDRTDSEKRELKETQIVIQKLTKALKRGDIDVSSIPEISALLEALGVSEDEE